MRFIPLPSQCFTDCFPLRAVFCRGVGITAVGLREPQPLHSAVSTTPFFGKHQTLLQRAYTLTRFEAVPTRRSHPAMVLENQHFTGLLTRELVVLQVQPPKRAESTKLWRDFPFGEKRNSV